MKTVANDVNLFKVYLCYSIKVLCEQRTDKYTSFALCCIYILLFEQRWKFFCLVIRTHWNSLNKFRAISWYFYSTCTAAPTGISVSPGKKISYRFNFEYFIICISLESIESNKYRIYVKKIWLAPVWKIYQNFLISFSEFMRIFNEKENAVDCKWKITTTHLPFITPVQYLQITVTNVWLFHDPWFSWKKILDKFYK